MKFLFSIFILLSISFSAFSDSFQCKLNLDASSAVPDKKKYKDFSYTPDSKSTGSIANLENIQAMLWVRSDMINVSLSDTKVKQKILTQFSNNRDSFFLKYGKDVELKCVSEKGSANISNIKFDSEIALMSDLNDYKKNLAIKTIPDLKIKFAQNNVQKQMRPIIFQYGKLYTADDQRDLDRNFCIFNFQIKRFEDINILGGTFFKGSNISIYRNNATHYIFSISFVDQATAKKQYDHEFYSPLTLECNINNYDVFTYSLFKKITGDRIELGIKNN